MPSVFGTVAFAAGFVSSVAAAFSPSGKTNVVTYWGQGAYQQRLVETCKIAAVDVINIGFVNRFPDNTQDGYPGTNFGNACYGDVYKNASGADTQLLKTCPYIGPDVITCQQTYGKKIFLSIGGGYPTDYYIGRDQTGRDFADFLWGAWGPVNSSWTGPRPWGNAVVDGFDFDIESVDVSPASRLTSGYSQMINRLKNTLYPQDPSKSYYISGAPQCTLPDVHFTRILSLAWFDFIWVQFYNTPQCSARAGINYLNGANRNQDISYTNWTQATSVNRNVKYYLGLAAAPGAAIDNSYYLSLSEAQRTVARFFGNSLFGGVMLWEATFAKNNTVCNRDQLSWHKDILNGQAAGRPAVLTCSSTATTTSTPVRAAAAAAAAGTTTSNTIRPTSPTPKPSTTTTKITYSATTVTRVKRSRATTIVTRIQARQAAPSPA